jgi:hypothetical protein
MAKQRMINTMFWSDEFITELQSHEKLLFLYLLTNHFTDICGAYRLGFRHIVFDTQLSEDQVRSALDRFESAGKIIYRDGWIVILNFIKNQNRNPKVDMGIKRSLKDCPEWVRDRLSIAYEGILLPIAPNLTETESRFNPNRKPNTQFQRDTLRVENKPSEQTKDAAKHVFDQSNQIKRTDAEIISKSLHHLANRNGNCAR